MTELRRSRIRWTGLLKRMFPFLTKQTRNWLNQEADSIVWTMKLNSRESISKLLLEIISVILKAKYLCTLAIVIQIIINNRLESIGEIQIRNQSNRRFGGSMFNK
mmetsp:Transcript_3680/g.7497  ORF Transcript_3680/g.7497 Transcript_3680/m.7497 type:complete len:105 (+) Transcript_3680:110-424(+)